MNKPLDWCKNIVILMDNTNFIRFIDGLRVDLAEQDKVNRRNTGETMYRGQGKAQYLADLLDDIDVSQKAVRKHR